MPQARPLDTPTHIMAHAACISAMQPHTITTSVTINPVATTMTQSSQGKYSPSSASQNNAHNPEQLLKKKRQLERLSHLLDDAFTIPILKIPVGWDAIIGLIPVIGDIIGALLSFILVIQAIRLKAGTLAIFKMLLNIGIELMLGLVPVLGDFFDVTWRANRKNYALLERHLNKQLMQAGMAQSQTDQEKPDYRRWTQLILALLCIAALWMLWQEWQLGHLQLPWRPNTLPW